jgi:hypothetical protein
VISLLQDRKSRRPYIYKFLSLSLYSFPPSFLSFLDIESCVYMPHAEREGERLAPQTGHEAPSNVSQSSHSQVAFRPVWKSLDPFACAFFCLKTFQQRVFKLRFAIVNNNPPGFCSFFETTPPLLRNGYFPPRERKIDRSFSVIII